MNGDPVVVYGPLRGGTTMIRLMLDGHPDLTVPGESDFLFDYLRQDGDHWRYDMDDLAESRIFQDSGLTLPQEKDGAAAVRAMVEQMAVKGRGRPVLVLHRHLYVSAKILSGMQVIRLQRDPRDVARSSIGMGWAGNVYHGLDAWLATERHWRDFVSAFPDVPVHALRYEELVKDPDGELRRICDFLKIDFTSDLLAYPARTSYAAPNPKFALQWRRKLSDREIQMIESRMENFWKNSGYEPSGLPLHKPNTFERMFLRFENRSTVWKHMIGRYGPVLPVIRGIGRRLRLPALKHAANRKISDIDRLHLK